MRTINLCAAVALCIVPSSQLAAEEVSVERGLYISIIGGCHFCHTEGYREAEGKIDPKKALKGSSLGWRGPWGTTYAVNLRHNVLGSTDADDWAADQKSKAMRALPPMPWYQVQAMDENDLRSLYLYIKSLGEPGELAPYYRSIGKEPKTPYVTLEPPQMPKK